MSFTELFPAADRTERLRERLLDMRDEALDRMLRRGAVEPGHLPILAGIEAALRALDDQMTTAEQGAATATLRADKRSICLIVDGAAGKTAISLGPLAAVRLGGELLDAAGLRLADDLARVRRVSK
jgi:hypothetical protein